jgi:predicted GNAT family N-acyltransferase
MELSTIVEIRATDPLMSAVYALRHEVFVVEQGVPEEFEIDEDDKVATHLAALSDATSLERCASCTMSARPRSAGWRYHLRHEKKGSGES